MLVVDDEPTLLALMARIVAKLGCDVREAMDGPGALAWVEREAVDLVISDVQMPGGGVAFIERLRVLSPDVPIVFVTGFAELEVARRLAEFGPMLSKPFNVTALSELVTNALQLPLRASASQ